MIRRLKERYGKFIQDSGSGFGPDPHWFCSPQTDLDPHDDKKLDPDQKSALKPMRIHNTAFQLKKCNSHKSLLSYFWEFKVTQIYLNFWLRFLIRELFDTGSRIRDGSIRIRNGLIRIRDGLIQIPDKHQQHWCFEYSKFCSLRVNRANRITATPTFPLSCTPLRHHLECDEAGGRSL